MRPCRRRRSSRPSPAWPRCCRHPPSKCWKHPPSRIALAVDNRARIAQHAALAGRAAQAGEGSMGEISPELFVETANSHLRTSAIKAAVELDVFTAIGEGAEDAAAIGPRTGAAARGIQALADFLTVMGFLDKSEGRYKLTPSSAAFLDRRSPAFVGDMHHFLASPEMVKLTLDDPAAFVRNGGSAGLANMAPDNPIWVDFARYMAPLC